MDDDIMNELAAALDCVAWVGDQVEDLSAADAVAVSQALGRLADLAKKTASLCQTRALNLLEGQPVKVDGTVYVPQKTGKWRPDQKRIASLVVAHAATDSDGKERTAKAAAAEAERIMRDMFVSPSSMPKQGAMDRLGIKAKDVATWENTGTQLVAVATEGPKEDG